MTNGQVQAQGASVRDRLYNSYASGNIILTGNSDYEQQLNAHVNPVGAIELNGESTFSTISNYTGSDTIQSAGYAEEDFDMIFVHSSYIITREVVTN